MNYSMTMSGQIVRLIMAGALIFGVDLDDGIITEVVGATIFLLSEAVSWYGRYRQGDITFYGRKLK